MKEILQYIHSDYQRYTGNSGGGVRNILLYLLTGRNHCFNYCFWLRLASKKSILFPLARYMHGRLTTKYGIQIPRTTKIGYGFYIGHGIGIVINGGTIIGNNVNISQFLSIGTNNSTPAVIGDNVYIGPHVSIVEDVHIGSNSTIGAGSVVVHDVPEGSTVAGVPAKVISHNDNSRYVHNRYNVPFA